jgi:hypothetical protein
LKQQRPEAAGIEQWLNSIFEEFFVVASGVPFVRESFPEFRCESGIWMIGDSPAQEECTF